MLVEHVRIEDGAPQDNYFVVCDECDELHPIVWDSDIDAYRNYELSEAWDEAVKKAAENNPEMDITCGWEAHNDRIHRP